MAAQLPPVPLLEGDSPQTYKERIHRTSNPITRRLLEIMDRKKTNLSFNADVTDANVILRFADQLGPYICMLKTHCDIITNYSEMFTEQLVALSRKHDFLLFEDRKFSDIGAVVKEQYGRGVHRIVEWSDVITCHAMAGPGCLEGLAAVGVEKQRGCWVVAEMSSKGSLCLGSYTEECLKMSEPWRHFVVGFVCQRRITPDQGFLHLTPGIQLKKSEDGLGQQFNTPEHAIEVQYSDIIQVGRGITQSEDPVQTAQEYRSRAWAAYTRRVGS